MGYSIAFISLNPALLSCRVVLWGAFVSLGCPNGSKAQQGRMSAVVSFQCVLPFLVIQRHQCVPLSFHLFQRCLVVCALLGSSERLDHYEPPKFASNDGKVVISPREQGFSKSFHFPPVTLIGLHGMY